MKYKLTTLLMIQIKNEDALSEAMDDSALTEVMKQTIDMFKETVSACEGSMEEDPLGRYPESGLASFSGPSAALAAAFRFSKELSLSDNPSRTGCAIHTGEILVRNNAIMGRTLDVVTKLVNMAENGEILFTESVLLSAETDETMIYHPHLACIEELSGPSMSIFSLEKLGDTDGES